jgi:hypothetical protein
LSRRRARAGTVGIRGDARRACHGTSSRPHPARTFSFGGAEAESGLDAACRPAGLSALEGHYADDNTQAQSGGWGLQSFQTGARFSDRFGFRYWQEARWRPRTASRSPSPPHPHPPEGRAQLTGHLRAWRALVKRPHERPIELSPGRSRARPISAAARAAALRSVSTGRCCSPPTPHREVGGGR